MIYTFDHEPPHVHAYGAGEAKIQLVGELGLPEIIWSVGLKNKDKARILDEVTERIGFFRAKWEEYHG